MCATAPRENISTKTYMYSSEAKTPERSEGLRTLTSVLGGRRCSLWLVCLLVVKRLKPDKKKRNPNPLQNLTLCIERPPSMNAKGPVSFIW